MKAVGVLVVAGNSPGHAASGSSSTSSNTGSQSCCWCSRRWCWYAASSTFVTSLNAAAPNYTQSLISAVDGVLVVIILVDIMRTVLTHLEGWGFPFRPFLVIGIIAAVRDILAVSTRLTLSSGSQPPERRHPLRGHCWNSEPMLRSFSSGPWRSSCRAGRTSTPRLTRGSSARLIGSWRLLAGWPHVQLPPPSRGGGRGARGGRGAGRGGGGGGRGREGEAYCGSLARLGRSRFQCRPTVASHEPLGVDDRAKRLIIRCPPSWSP